MHERAKALAVAPLLLLCGEERVPLTAQDDLACRFRHRVETVESLRALPGWLKRYVHRQFDPIADRGEFFNSTDVIMRDGPGRRFIRAGHSGARWFVWYEQGGISFAKVIVLFEPSGSGGWIAKGEHRGNWNANLCAETDSILEGRPL